MFWLLGGSRGGRWVGWDFGGRELAVCSIYVGLLAEGRSRIICIDRVDKYDGLLELM